MAAVAVVTLDTLPFALTASTKAHRAYRTAMHSAVAPAASTAQARWLHAKNALRFTSLLASSRPVAQLASIPALQSSEGALLHSTAVH